MNYTKKIGESWAVSTLKKDDTWVKVEYDESENIISPIGLAEQILSENKSNLLRSYSISVQNYLDSEAQKLGYDNIFTAVTYADESSIAKFQNDGIALRRWRSLVWEKCYDILNKVESGEIIAPTIDSLISQLPVFTI